MSAGKRNATATIIDVADRAGVSIKTVSRVINDEPSVREKTRDKVLAAVKALGYQRNVFARGLRADRSLVLGLLYENPQGDYPADVLHGALAYCRLHGYHLVVEVLRGRNMGEQTTRFLSQTRLDGVLMTPPVCDNPAVLKACASFGVPYVRISPRKPKKGEQYIAIDDFAAAKEVTEYLLSLGHRRIGLIKGIPGHAATIMRLAGYKDALEKAGINYDEDLVFRGDFHFESGASGAAQFLGLKDPATAIFAGNDETAAGALAYAHEKGVAVPEKLSVCGFDGGTISKVVWPRLTTVLQPTRLLGETAVSILINAGTAPRASTPIILPHKLIVGLSTAPLRA